jgi:hypothetical protein
MRSFGQHASYPVGGRAWSRPRLAGQALADAPSRRRKVAVGGYTLHTAALAALTGAATAVWQVGVALAGLAVPARQPPAANQPPPSAQPEPHPVASATACLFGTADTSYRHPRSKVPRLIGSAQPNASGALAMPPQHFLAQDSVC